MNTVWKTLASRARETGKAFTVLAPMEDVTDTVFRQIVFSQGRPDVFMTEFTNCDGLASRGRERVVYRLKFTPEQKPIIAQIWGRNPETYVEAIPLIASLGFDGIDINMGCPVPKVIKSGAGSGLICIPDLAEKIVVSVREAIGKSERPEMALSVKTRIGFDEISLEWVQHVLQLPIDAAIFHLRTTKELSKVPAHWNMMEKIAELRDKVAPELPIIGNGDIGTKQQLETYFKKHRADGLMVGRGIFDNLWLFSKDVVKEQVTRAERLALVQRHIELFQQTWSDRKKNFEMIKKYFKIYLKEFDDAATIRNALLRLKTADEMLAYLATIN
jgi:tRNA-dihydrouridine synthase